MFYAYILKSFKTEKYYIGSTHDLEARLARHNAGRNKSTKEGIPWELVYREEFPTEQDAYRREFQIKSYKGGCGIQEIDSQIIRRGG